MTQFDITGMGCAACAARIEKAVSSVDGVTGCTVNLLTNSMSVEGSAKDQDIIQAVEAAGYGASLKEDVCSGNQHEKQSSLENSETLNLKKRLITSVIFLVPLMYFSMGFFMWNWPLPLFLKNNTIAVCFSELILAMIIMVINKSFFINGFKGLFHRSPNMDTLVALGSSASFIFSLYAFFSMFASLFAGNNERFVYFINQLYFDSAAAILTLVTVGKTLESYSKGKTTSALKALIKLTPQTAVIIKDGKEIQVDIDTVKVGDIFAVHPGSSIPADGIVLQGESAVNESALTGESIPVEKKMGDKVSAATINTSGYLVCKAERIGQNTTLAGIIKMVSEASATKAPIAKIADKVSGIFVPVVMSISVITFIAWLVAGQTLGFSLCRAVSVLVISCPCALGLATPVAIMVGNGVAAKNGILFKTSESLEQTGKAEYAVLDKTGTITQGKPYVVKIIPATEVNSNKLLETAFILEKQSEHPLAKAITEYGETQQLNYNAPLKFEAVFGRGVKALIQDVWTFGGNRNFILENCKSENIQNNIDDCLKLIPSGVTPLFFAAENQFLGIICVADQIKADSAQAVAQLKALGLTVFMLTGDNKETAQAVAKEAGIESDNVIAEVLPGNKADEIKKLQKNGSVIMIGDGINDAPALTCADIGIAIGAGTDIAIDSADIVLMKNTLIDAVEAVKISRNVIKNIHQNLFWAFIYNSVGIPLAAGCFIKLFGWSLNPMFCAMAMGLSSFCVVTNALRLRYKRTGKNKKI